VGRGEFTSRAARQARAAGAEPVPWDIRGQTGDAAAGSDNDGADAAGPVLPRPRLTGFAAMRSVRRYRGGAVVGAGVAQWSGHDGHDAPSRAEVAALAARPAPAGASHGRHGCRGHRRPGVHCLLGSFRSGPCVARVPTCNWWYFSLISVAAVTFVAVTADQRRRGGRGKSSGSPKGTWRFCRSRSCSSC